MSPSGRAAKARFARFLAASDRETRFSSSWRLRLKAIRLVAWSQNEVYPVRRLTDVALEQPQSEVYPVLGRF